MMNIKNTYKVALIGDGGVGKTPLVKRWITGKFEHRTISTLGVDVHPVDYKNTRFNVWDCAGLEKFGGLRDGYYIESDFVFVMFDISNEESFKHVKNWVQDVRKVLPHTKIYIIANKLDMVETGNMTEKQINKMVDRCVKLEAVTMSVKNNTNVWEILDKVLRDQKAFNQKK